MSLYNFVQLLATFSFARTVATPLINHLPRTRRTDFSDGRDLNGQCVPYLSQPVSIFSALDNAYTGNSNSPCITQFQVGDVSGCVFTANTTSFESLSKPHFTLERSNGTNSFILSTDIGANGTLKAHIEYDNLVLSHDNESSPEYFAITCDHCSDILDFAARCSIESYSTGFCLSAVPRDTTTPNTNTTISGPDTANTTTSKTTPDLSALGSSAKIGLTSCNNTSAAKVWNIIQSINPSDPWAREVILSLSANGTTQQCSGVTGQIIENGDTDYGIKGHPSKPQDDGSR